ncbi:MAG: ankyrin repeat domain-containing protein [Sumerlaeia bacterium]
MPKYEREAADIKEFVEAAGEGDIGAVRAALAAGMAIDSPIDSGETALMRAARKRQPLTIEYLLDQGADLLCGDNADRNALHHAVMGSASDVVHLLCSRSKLMLEQRSSFGRTPLDLALHVRNTELAKILSLYGAPVSPERLPSERGI